MPQAEGASTPTGEKRACRGPLSCATTVIQSRTLRLCHSRFAMFELAGSVILLVALAGAVMSRRQARQDCESFSATMERICEGVKKLWAIEGESRFGTLQAISRDDQAEMRALCRRLIGDMLRNACYIANRAFPSLPSSGGETGGEHEDREGESEILASPFHVSKLADRLILRLRWLRLRMVFRPAGLEGCRKTLAAAQQYAELWSAVVRLLEDRVPGLREALAAVE